MDTPGSDSATDSSDSSTSDSSSEGSPSAQIITSLNENSHSGDKSVTTSAIDGGNDSESDISMSAETDDEDEEASNRPVIQVNADMNIQEQPSTLVKEPTDISSHKRKYSEPMETPNGQVSNGLSQEDRKRLKPDDLNGKYTNGSALSNGQSLLPAEIWHRIFTYVSPRGLGMLFRVNKAFKAYLDPSSGNTLIPPSNSAVQLLKPDFIWRASRRLFWPGMPVPLQGKSELDMWKMACAFHCQFCGKKQSTRTIPSDQYHPGPGENGVSPVWSFGVRSCGPCIQKRSLKVELICHSTLLKVLLITGRKSTCFYHRPCLPNS